MVGSEVTGWGSRNLDNQPSGFNQSGVLVLVLSLKLPSSSWVRVLVSSELSDCSVYPLRKNQDPAPWLQYCFFSAFPLFLHSLTLLISNCLNLPCGTQGRSWSPFLTHKKWGTQKSFCAWEPHRVLLGFNRVVALGIFLSKNECAYLWDLALKALWQAYS